MDNKKLEALGHFWKPSEQDVVVLPHFEQLLEELNKVFSQDNFRAVVVAGEPGVGKSTFLEYACGRLIDAGWRVFVSGAEELLGKNTEKSGIEKDVARLLDELAKGEKCLWCVPAIDELFMQPSTQQEPLKLFEQVIPFLEKGRLHLLADADAEQWQLILQFLPYIRPHFFTSLLKPLDPASAIALARQWIDLQPPKLWEKIDDATLQEVSALTYQYLLFEEEPGNLMNFLKATRDHALSNTGFSGQLTLDHFLALLSGYTGIPTVILDDRKKLELEAVRAYFNQHVVGQEEAVNVVIERIAMIKAGLTDPEKPEAVYLFVGPAGTGKTAVARTLAGYLYGSEERFISLDLADFQDANAPAQLFGPDSFLVQRLFQQPYTVIFLDSVEKAHPTVWETLEQVFDQGLLRTANGQFADLRHAFIILSTTVGATYSGVPQIGFGREQERPAETQYLALLSKTFGADFINRVDRIVRFNPLNRASLRNIMQKELQQVLQRRGFRQRQWAVEWEDSALEFLMEKGYSDKLGARPMKRAIEKYLLAPLALTIVSNQFPAGDQFLFVKKNGEALKVDFVNPDAPQTNWKELEKKTRAEKKKAADLSVRQIVMDPRGTLAEKEALLRAFSAFDQRYMENHIDRKKEELLYRTYDPGFWDSPGRHEVLDDIELLDRMDTALETTRSLLDRLEGEDKGLNFPPDLMQGIAQKVYLLDLALSAYLEDDPQDALVRIHLPEGKENDPESQAFLGKIFQMHLNWARKRRMKYEVLTDQPAEKILTVSGFGAFSILEPTSGIHVWEKTAEGHKTLRQRSYVDIVAAPGQALEKPSHAQLISYFPNTNRKIIRTYKAGNSPLVKDNIRGWRTGLLQKVLEGDFDLFEK